MSGQHDGSSARGMTDDRSMGQVVGDLMGNAQEIIRGEIRLAKAETRQEAVQAVSSSAMLVAGGVVAIFAFQMLLFTIIWILDTGMPLWVAGAIVTLVVSTAAAALIVVGKSRLKHVDLKPTQTIESVKETTEWLKRQTQSG